MNKTVLQTSRNSYFLRFSINAHCEAEELLGFPITQLNEKTTGVSTLRTLLFVGLKHGGNPVSMEQAGNIMEEVISEQGMEYFTDKISEAVQKGLNQQTNQGFVQSQGKKN